MRKHERAFRNNPWVYAKKCCSAKKPTSVLKQRMHIFKIQLLAVIRLTRHFQSGWTKLCPSPNVMSQLSLIYWPLPLVLSERSWNVAPLTLPQGKTRLLTTYEEVTLCPPLLGDLVFKDLTARSAPESWCQAKIILIPKNEDLSNPENFHPISLTSAIGKLFNKILALLLERFLRDNDIIDTNLQKGFLANINGTMEHIFATSAIIQNAVQNGLPLSVTFLDLKSKIVLCGKLYLGVEEVLDNC